MQRLRALIGVCSIIAMVSAPVARAQWGGYSRNSAYSTQIAALGDTAAVSLPVPILLGVVVTDLDENFGDPRSDGRLHQGLDIMAPHGTPIGSPTAAVVTGVGNGSSSGLYVRTANPGGETFVYMHLSQVATGIARGTILARGDILGFVGNTGNASGGAAHLHFEIRKGGVATDPFVRLKEVFSLKEQISGVTQAFERTTNAELAATLAKNFRATFASAVSVGIVLPPVIETALAESATGNDVVSNIRLPNALTQFGDEGEAVSTVQTYLIARGTGPAAVRLATAGATGYFGVITSAALIEYQNAVSLPPTGYVDQATYLYMFDIADAGEIENDDGDAPLMADTSFRRDLTIGHKGEDVKRLQQFLNSRGFIVDTTGAGSPGLESIYFGGHTQSALSKFQEANGIAPAVGYFGPMTRAFLNSSAAS